MAQRPVFVRLLRLALYDPEVDEPQYIYMGVAVHPNCTLPVDIALGRLQPGQAWWEVPLPPCPDCNGPLQWQENGYAPGARGCRVCGSMFSVETFSMEEV